MNNYKILFSLRILKGILTSFVDSFLILYFLQVSNSNILPLGIYKLVAIFGIYGVIFFARNYCKSKHRANLMRIGIVLDFVYFLTIILLKEKVVDYLYFVGLLYGLEEGFYYSVYNMLESDGVTNGERARFTGNYTAVNAILSVLFPLIFGSLIQQAGFIKSLLIVLVIVICRMILSFQFKDRNIPKSSKTNLKEFIKIAKQDNKIKQACKREFFNGLTYSEGAFSYIVTIYIIKVFSDSMSLGIFTSIFSIISSLLGFLFAKVIKKEQYAKMIKISTSFTIIFLCIMIYHCDMTTIILFNFFQTFSKGLESLISSNNLANISNIEIIKNEYKVEYFLSLETSLFLGRILSNGLFILMAFTDTNIIMYLFVLFLVLFAKSALQLQKIVENKEG